MKAVSLMIKVPPPPEKSDSPAGSKEAWPTVVGAILAFVPAIFFLTLKDKHVFGDHSLTYTFGLACAISLVCCLTSSFLLFRRRTGGVIFFGFVFLLINLFISFMLGCGTLLSR